MGCGSSRGTLAHRLEGLEGEAAKALVVKDLQKGLETWHPRRRRRVFLGTTWGGWDLGVGTWGLVWDCSFGRGSLDLIFSTFCFVSVALRWVSWYKKINGSYATQHASNWTLSC